jgi:hypothetical protein
VEVLEHSVRPEQWFARDAPWSISIAKFFASAKGKREVTIIIATKARSPKIVTVRPNLIVIRGQTCMDACKRVGLLRDRNQDQNIKIN